jgi:hypothetical protein
MILGFLAQTIIALAERVPLSFGFWSWIAAGETAAWRLKWVFVPLTFVVLWGGRRVYQTMMQTPARFVGLKTARRGLVASVLVVLTIATLIGITVPARLRQRRDSLDATERAKLYTIARAQLEYQAVHGMAPDFVNDLKDLPDPDGSIAEALLNLDPSGYRTIGADVAVAGKPKRRILSGAALQNASINPAAEDATVGGFSIMNYELRLPGDDKIVGTDDDVVLRDGVIMTVAEAKETVKPAAATARSRKP